MKKLASIDLQCLIEKLGQVIQNGHIGYGQRRPGRACGCQRRIVFVPGERNHWNMTRRGVLFQPRNRLADFRLMRLHICKHYNWFLALRLFNQPSGVGNRLNAIPGIVLKQIFQLSAWKQSLVKEQCKWLRHFFHFGRPFLKLQTSLKSKCRSAAFRPPQCPIFEGSITE